MEKKTPWWKGPRGEWYVVGQVALIALVFAGPRTVPEWPAWVSPYAQVATVLGGVLMAVGLLLLVTAMRSLGPNLTPMPRPKEEGKLVETGAFRFVRHPMYSGGTLLTLGWALLVHGWLTLGYAVVLFIYHDIKARREEKWLREKFPEYTEYARRVHRLIPFIY